MLQTLTPILERNLFKQIDGTSSSQSREVRTKFVPRGMRLACVVNLTQNKSMAQAAVSHAKYVRSSYRVVCD